MEEKEYIRAMNEVLDSVGPILEDIRRCIFSDDHKCLEKAEKAQKAALKSCLPLAEELTDKKERGMVELRFMALLPSIQKLGIEIGNLLRASGTKIESSIPFNDKALKELKEVIVGTQNLARDAKDCFLTKNPRLGQRMQSDLSALYKMADDFSVEHQDRLIRGLCSPKASYLYLQMMESLKRAMAQLVLLGQQA